STLTYRALYGYSNASPFTCGLSPLGAALEASGQHVFSGWGDPQTPNYSIIVSNGRPNKLSNGNNCNNLCDCPDARNEAIAKRNAMVAQGTRVFVVYLNEVNCNSCSAAQINAGKAFLQNQ